MIGAVWYDSDSIYKLLVQLRGCPLDVACEAHREQEPERVRRGGRSSGRTYEVVMHIGWMVEPTPTAIAMEVTTVRGFSKG